MKLQPYDAQVDLTNHDFNARVENDTLLIPSGLFNEMRTWGLNTVEEFLSCVVCFPTSLVTLLGWTYEELNEAKEKLRPILKGHVDERYFDRPTPIKRAYGTLPPDPDQQLGTIGPDGKLIQKSDPRNKQ